MEMKMKEGYEKRKSEGKRRKRENMKNEKYETEIKKMNIKCEN
jgi:hypothetical protein